MNGFTFGGRHCSEFGVTMRSKDRPILPELRHNDMEIPGRDGVLDLGHNTYAVRIIEIACFVTSENLPSFRQRLREIAKWLSTKSLLSFDDEPDKTYYGRIYSAVSLEQILANGSFTLIFECDPMAQGKTVVEYVGMLGDQDERLLYNEGTAPSPGIITITNQSNATIPWMYLTLLGNEIE